MLKEPQKVLNDEASKKIRMLEKRLLSTILEFITLTKLESNPVGYSNVIVNALSRTSALFVANEIEEDEIENLIKSYSIMFESHIRTAITMLNDPDSLPGEDNE